MGLRLLHGCPYAYCRVASSMCAVVVKLCSEEPSSSWRSRDVADSFDEDDPYIYVQAAFVASLIRQAGHLTWTQGPGIFSPSVPLWP